MNEAGLYTDARAAYDFVRDSLHAPSSRIIIFGHSLGTGVATQLASTVPAAGLVLEGAYQSLDRIGQEMYPWLPVSLIMTNHFPSIDRIADVAIPKLFLHAADDDVIPIAHARALLD